MLAHKLRVDYLRLPPLGIRLSNLLHHSDVTHNCIIESPRNDTYLLGEDHQHNEDDEPLKEGGRGLVREREREWEG